MCGKLNLQINSFSPTFADCSHYPSYCCLQPSSIYSWHRYYHALAISSLRTCYNLIELCPITDCVNTFKFRAVIFIQQKEHWQTVKMIVRFRLCITFIWWLLWKYLLQSLLDLMKSNFITSIYNEYQAAWLREILIPNLPEYCLATYIPEYEIRIRFILYLCNVQANCWSNFFQCHRLLTIHPFYLFQNCLTLMRGLIITVFPEPSRPKSRIL